MSTNKDLDLVLKIGSVILGAGLIIKQILEEEEDEEVSDTIQKD